MVSLAGRETGDCDMSPCVCLIVYEAPTARPDWHPAQAAPLHGGLADCRSV